MPTRKPRVIQESAAAEPVEEPAVADEIVRGTLTFDTADGVTTIRGENIEARDGQHLNVCFNGRTYHAITNPYAGFKVIVPAFEGEVEVWTANKLDLRLVARGVA